MRVDRLPNNTFKITTGNALQQKGNRDYFVKSRHLALGTFYLSNIGLELIFDKFTQSSHTQTGAGGTGLGLAISREIILAHNGTIQARNHPDGGAVFNIILPKNPIRGDCNTTD